MEHARARSGKIPDLSYRLPSDAGAGDRAGRQLWLLAELKMINAGPTRYPRGNMSKAVDRRARALPGEYRRTLARLDRQLHGTVEGQAGPLEVRLEELVGDDGLQCFVVGRWGEASQHLHNFVQSLAEARALHLARLTGIPTSAGTLASVIGSYRHILSCSFVRANESCLIARMGHLGPGARDAAVRRQVAVRRERLAREEAAAHYQEYVRGREGPMRGRLPP